MLEFLYSESNEIVWRKSMHTNIGLLEITATNRGIAGVDWIYEADVNERLEGTSAINTTLEEEGASVVDKNHEARQWVDEAVRQLTEYFAGTRTEFDLKLDIHGTDFQKSVWQALAQIPYGKTQSYKDIATHIGKPTAVRAVGQANRRNPVAVIVPCHRVIGAGGQLVGYAGSQTHLKEGLLQLEQAT